MKTTYDAAAEAAPAREAADEVLLAPEALLKLEAKPEPPTRRRLLPSELLEDSAGEWGSEVLERRRLHPGKALVERGVDGALEMLWGRRCPKRNVSHLRLALHFVSRLLAEEEEVVEQLEGSPVDPDFVEEVVGDGPEAGESRGPHPLRRRRCRWPV